MIIAIDFDGTVVTHKYPTIGTELPNCVDIIKSLVGKGIRLYFTL